VTRFDIPYLSRRRTLVTLPALLTPCIGVCTLAPDGHCDGCFRTGDEIAAWTALSNDERQRFMDVVLPEREARRGAGTHA